jgi:hypothetical protein
MNEENSKFTHKKFILFCLIGFLILIIWLTYLLKSTKIKEQVHPPAQMSNPPQIHAASSYQKSIYSKGEKLTIDMIANTQGKPLSGFDVVLHFDPSIVSFESVSTHLPSFDVYTNKNTDTVSVTGSLKLNAQALPVKEDSLFSVSFTPLHNGNPKFSLEYIPGKRSDSNLIDDKSQDILKNVYVDKFLIGSSFKLPRGKSVSIGDSLQATLQSVTVANQNCADCTNDATVVYSANGKIQTIKYVEGGIEGKISRSETVGNFLIQLESIHNEYIMVGVYKIK